MKILLVEDDAATREYMTDTLRTLGYPLEVAQDGEQGLQRFRVFRPNLVITDIQMPRLDGLGLLAAIREWDNESIVIVTTAFGSEEYAIQALKLRANNYLPKPVSPLELLALVRKYAQVVDEVRVVDEIAAMTRRRTFEMEFDNRLNLVPKIADYLLREASARIAPEDALGVRLGLTEMISNAIEHGNLAIGAEDKASALQANRFDTLCQERMGIAAYNKRRVRVHFTMDAQGCRWVITDEGKGFDWRGRPPADDPEMLLRLSGRGIFLTRFEFDEMAYNESGNEVTLIKHAPEVL